VRLLSRLWRFFKPRDSLAPAYAVLLALAAGLVVPDGGEERRLQRSE